MSCSKITLIGLYNYDPTIFDNLTFPVGIVKEVAINEILLKSGEFEIVYPDPEFLKSMIEHWGKKCYRIFEKWIEALSIEFNPLYNYDRFEEYADSRTKQDERQRADERTHNDINLRSDDRESNDNASSVSATNSTTDDDTTQTTSVSAYDSTTYQPKEQTVTNHDVAVSANDNSVSSTNSKESASSSETLAGNEAVNASESGKENELTQHNAHLYGNIGVTTSTQMLEDFLRVERFNIYEQIADIFITEFCVLVYE